MPTRFLAPIAGLKLPAQAESLPIFLAFRKKYAAKYDSKNRRLFNLFLFHIMKVNMMTGSTRKTPEIKSTVAKDF
jgi:hypothetical protein